MNSNKLALKPNSFNFFKVKFINKETNDKGIKTKEIQLSLTELDAQDNQLKPIKSKKLEFLSIRPGMIF